METTNKTKDRPIIFSARNIPLLMDGRKTITRRIVGAGNSTLDGSVFPKSCHPWMGLDFNGADVRFKTTLDVMLVGEAIAPDDYHLCVPYPADESRHRIRSRWEVGHRLWVKEGFAVRGLLYSKPIADQRKYARIPDAVCYRADDEPATRSWQWRSPLFMPREFSRITLEITEVRAQRVQDISEADAIAEGCTGIAEFRRLWDEINGEGAWERNHWVWVVAFKMVK